MTNEDLKQMKELLNEQKREIMSEVNVLFESSIQPQFNLLSEGQQAILGKVAPKSRVEELEEKVDFLESIMRSMNKDLQELKKAQ